MHFLKLNFLRKLKNNYPSILEIIIPIIINNNPISNSIKEGVIINVFIINVMILDINSPIIILEVFFLCLFNRYIINLEISISPSINPIVNGNSIFKSIISLEILLIFVIRVLYIPSINNKAVEDNPGITVPNASVIPPRKNTR